MDICIRTIKDLEGIKKEQIINMLTEVLSYDEIERIDVYKKFWRDWLDDKIEGEKITITAEESDEKNGLRLVGVVRFWRTPYCKNKWFIEGLEVIPERRRLGIAKSMIEYGIKLLKNKGVEKVSANIANNNTASIKLHEGLKFQKISNGTINSYGDYRDNADEYILPIKDNHC